MASSTPAKLSRFDLPGFTLPLNFTPNKAFKKHVYDAASSGMKKVHVPASGEGEDLFPSALSPGESEIRNGCTLPLTTLREFTMIQVMDHITDKPDWEVKVSDDGIVAKWEAESRVAPRSGGLDISPAMFRWIIQELRYKAKIFNETKGVSLYNGDVVKSDSKVPKSLKEALKSAVVPLEAIPEVYKDYHPRSDGKVIDLVHPSLFPLIYNRSRILPDKLVGLGNCLEMTGLGNIIAPRSKDEGKDRDFLNSYYEASSAYSMNYQWLPCEVEFSGLDKEVKIVSYINNLHPQKHQDLYPIIEQMISHAIPLWNMTLTPLKDSNFRWERIKFSEPHYDPDPDHLPDNEKLQKEENESEDDYWERNYVWEEQFRKAHLVLPEPGTFKLPEQTILSNPENAVDLKRDYCHRGLQVIVKLATISLTPEKPSYEGGSWHVEGQMVNFSQSLKWTPEGFLANKLQKNEHICATALYYYDSVNITTSRLAFRQQSNGEDTIDIGYNQNDWVWSKPVFGIESEEACVQHAGDVVCKEGRLITFPNVLQHRVSPFELEDQNKPGHRKILALFLVDPNIRVISTANVPPQQREWWSEELKSTGCFKQLAAELQEKVFNSVDDFPIGMDEAKEIRLKLMDERGEYVVLQNGAFESVTFSLCEH